MSDLMIRMKDRILCKVFGVIIADIIYQYTDNKTLYYIQFMDDSGDSHVDAIFKTEICAINYLIIKHGAFGYIDDLPTNLYLNFSREPLMYGKDMFKDRFPNDEQTVLEDIEYHYGARLSELPCMNTNHTGKEVGNSICLKCLNYIICNECPLIHDYCVISPLLAQLHKSLKNRKNWLQNNAGFYAIQSVDSKYHNSYIGCDQLFL